MIQNAKTGNWRTAVVILAILVVNFAATAQQKPREKPFAQKLNLGRGMSLISSDLMQIAAQSDFFLQFNEKIDLSVEQRKKLEDLFFEFQKYGLRRQTDLDIVEAELQRLLNNDSIDLAAVRAKVKEIEMLQSEFTITKIETVLLAVNVLTHDQHLKVMLLVRKLLEEELKFVPNS